MSIKLKYINNGRFFNLIKKFFVFLIALFSFFVLFSFLFFSIIAYGPSQDGKISMINKMYNSKYFRFVPMFFFSKSYIIETLDNKTVLKSSNYSETQQNDDGQSYDQKVVYQQFKKDKFTINLFTISNPSDIGFFNLDKFSKTSKGLSVEDIAISKKAKFVFGNLNTSNKNGGMPVGLVVKDGKILVEPTKYTVATVGIDFDGNFIIDNVNKQKVIDGNLKNAFEVSKILIQNKNVMPLNPNEDRGNRLLIAQSQDKKIYVLSVFQHKADSMGATYKECIEFLSDYDIVNAASLYSDNALGLFYNGDIIGSDLDDTKYLATAFYVK